jgi:hypothetical protein
MSTNWLNEAMNTETTLEDVTKLNAAFSVHWTTAPSANQVYLRNNKSDCSKRLRCFPTCCSDGHATKSFCGNELSAIITSPLYVT